MFVRRIAPFFLLLSLIAGTVFVWQRIPFPCEQPLRYALGSFDERFGMSREDFLLEAAEAELVWEKALGRELFRYDAVSAFKVNLIFDERQERTIEAQKLEDSLNKTKDTEESLDQKQEKILAQYKKASAEYDRMGTAFKRRLDAYEKEVKKWNKAGGAPPEEYEDLQKVAKELEEEGKKLEVKRLEVNRLVVQVNAFSAQKVSVIEQYNDQVEEYVNRYGEPREFDQGDYVGEEINIYQYDDMLHLRAVLVHEFGHALGLSHGTDPRSVMFHLMKDQELDPLTLTAEDISMISVQCNQAVWDIVLQRIEILKQRF